MEKWALVALACAGVGAAGIFGTAGFVGAVVFAVDIEGTGGFRADTGAGVGAAEALGGFVEPADGDAVGIFGAGILFLRWVCVLFEVADAAAVFLALAIFAAVGVAVAEAVACLGFADQFLVAGGKQESGGKAECGEPHEEGFWVHHLSVV